MTKLTSAALWFAAAATSAMACVCPATTTCRLLGQQVLFAGEVSAVDGQTVQIRVKERFYGLPESPANVQLLVLDPCNGVRYSPGQLWVFGAGYWKGKLVQGPCGAIAMDVSGNSAALETIRLVTASRSKRRIFGLVGLSNHPRFFSVRMNAGIDRPAPGVRVSVPIKGRTIEAIRDQDGRFILDLPDLESRRLFVQPGTYERYANSYIVDPKKCSVIEIPMWEKK